MDGCRGRTYLDDAFLGARAHDEDVRGFLRRTGVGVKITFIEIQ
jgi:hypothetical protein